MKSEKEILQEKLNAINKKEKEDVIKNHYPEFKKLEGKFFKKKTLMEVAVTIGFITQKF